MVLRGADVKVLTAERMVTWVELAHTKHDLREYVEDCLWRDLTSELREVLEDGHPHRLQVMADMRRWSNDPLSLRYGDEIHRLRCYVDIPDDITVSTEDVPVPDSELVEKQVRLRRNPPGEKWY